MIGGRTIVITGGSSGIGAAAAGELAASGARVVVVGRNPERTAQAADRIGGVAFVADFDRFDDVRRLADDLLTHCDRIDVLANNAGGLVSRRESTPDGHERTIQSNHLAPFLLTALLLPRLIESAAEGPVRVVSTSSAAHRFGNLRLDDLDWRDRPWLGGWRAYGTAKIATILFMRELAERTSGTSVTAYSFHPGVIATRFGAQSRLMRLGNRFGAARVGPSVEEGAAPLVLLAAAEELDAPSGCYFDRMTPNAPTSPQARDMQLARDLWAASENAVGLTAQSSAA